VAPIFVVGLRHGGADERGSEERKQQRERKDVEKRAGMPLVPRSERVEIPLSRVEVIRGGGKRGRRACGGCGASSTGDSGERRERLYGRNQGEQEGNRVKLISVRDIQSSLHNR